MTRRSRSGPAVRPDLRGSGAVGLVRGSLLGLCIVTAAAFALRGQEVVADVPGDLETSLVRSWAGDGVTTVDGLVQVPLAILAGGTTGSYRFELYIHDADGTQLFRDSWIREVSGRAAAYAETDASTMLESFRFGIRPGTYEIEILAYPTDAADLGVRQTLALTAFAGRPVASDLFLATRVEPLVESSGGSWSVSRGGFGISAAARTVILADEAELFYYLELYGEEVESRVAIQTEVLSAGGTSLFRTPVNDVSVAVGGQAFTGRLPLVDLPAGNYELVMTVEGSGGEALVRGAPFEVRASVGPGLLTTAGRSELREYFESLSDAELESTFGGVAALLSEAERQTYQALPLDAKRRYLVEFFGERDPYPETPGNPFLDEYLERLATVRARYGERVGTAERAPWLTDRGRRYLQLGEPQNRVANYYPAGAGGATGLSSSGGEPPYEIWQYQDTGYVYLFIATNQFGAWSLIYSTDNNIPPRADWYRRIGPEAVQDLTQYFGIVPGR